MATYNETRSDMNMQLQPFSRQSQQVLPIYGSTRPARRNESEPSKESGLGVSTR